MKKRFLFLTFLVVISSCNIPNYYFERTQNTGVDFRSGNWLLNEIEAPKGVIDALTKKSKKDFTSFLGERVQYIHDAKGILIGKKVNLNPSINQMKDLRNGTNYDYFINVKAGVLKEELGSLNVSNSKFNANEENRSQVIIEIYDLQNLQIIYSNKVIGSTKTPENSSSDVQFSKSSENLIIGGYNKLIKDLSKKSIKKIKNGI